MAQAASAPFHFDSNYYLCYVGKKSKKKMQAIAGATVRLATAFPQPTQSTPALHMIRHAYNVALFTRPDGLGRFRVQAMENGEIDTKVPKYHSIREAAAMYLLCPGVPQPPVHDHGCRSSSQAPDDHHARPHMLLNWGYPLAG